LVNLSWAASIDPTNSNQTATGVQGYNVFRNGTLLQQVTSTSLSDSAVSVSATYTYGVSAVDGAGNASTTNTITVTIPLCPDSTPPNVPGAPSASALICNQVNVSWAAVADRTNPTQQVSGVKGYNVYRDNSFLTFVTNTSIGDLVPAGNVTYSYQISAVDKSNNESTRGPAGTITVPSCPDLTPPNVPAGLGVVALDCAQANLTWMPASDSVVPNQASTGVKGYNIYRGGAFLRFVNTTTTNAIDTGLLGNTSYSYQVSALDNVNNESPLSQAVVLTTPGCLDTTAPTVPSNLVINNLRCTQFSFSWSPSSDQSAPNQTLSGLMGYYVYRDDAFLQFTASPTVTDSTVTEGRFYRYRVSAVDAASNSSQLSTPLEVTIPSCAASPATNLRIVISNSKVGLQWSGSPGALYQVESTIAFGSPWFPVDGPTASFASTNHLCDPASMFRVAVFTNTPAYLANSLINRLDTTPPPIPAPLIVTASSSSETDLSWAPVADVGTFDPGQGQTFTSGLDRYLIYRDGTYLKSAPANVTNSVDLSIPPGGQHTYSVAAIDKAGNVSQKASDSVSICIFLEPSSAIAGPEATNGSFVVDATGCSWSASVPGDSSWIQLTSATSGSGTAAINYAVAANPEITDRVGTVLVQNRNYTVTQKGRKCTISVNPLSLNHSSAGGVGSFSVGAPSGCSWTATTGDGWIHTSTSGSGGGTVSYTVDSNGGASFRSGSISVGGLTFTVNQDGAAVGCTYTISSSVAGFPSAGGSSNVTVTTSSGCSWNVSNSPAWLTITPGGVGSSSVSYTVSANASSSIRTATFTIAGQSYTVTQNGNQLPLANAGSDVSITIGSTATFTAAGSADPDGSISSYQWTFGDGFTASGFSVTHPYSILGVYTVTLTVTDNLGATASDSLLATIVALPDITPPTVNLTVSGSPNVSGVVNLVATVSDNVGVNKTEFYRDDTLFTNITTSPYGTSFDTRTLANGSHTFTARTYDAANNNNSSVVTVLVDNTAPTVSLTQPASGSTISNTVTLAANASDNVGGSGISRVEFYCDTVPLGTATNAPYTNLCNTTIMSDGVHSFYSKAYDAAGNFTNSASVAVTVSNGSPAGQVTWASINPGAWYSATAPAANGDIVAVGSQSGSILLQKYRGGQLLWSKVFGSGNAIGSSLAIDSGGNIFVAGSYVTFIDFGHGSLPPGSGFSDIFVAKFDSDGNNIWGRGVVGQYSDSARGMALDSNGDVYITGSFSGNANFGTDTVPLWLNTVVQGSDIFLAKFSGQTGSTAWAKRFGASDLAIDGSLGVIGESGYSVAVNAYGEVFLTGTCMNGADFGGGPLITTGLNAFVAQFTTNGVHRWSKSFGGNDKDIGQSIAITPEGEAVLTGYFQGTMVLPNGGAGISLSTTRYDDVGDIFLARFSRAGNCIWGRSFTGSMPSVQDVGRGVTVSADGSILLTGEISGQANFGGGTVQANIDDMFVAKLTRDGNYGGWARTFGNGGSDAGIGIAVGNGRVFVASNCYGIVSFDNQGTSTGGGNGVLLGIAP